MKSPVPIRSVFTIALLFAAVAAAVSCGDGEGITPPPTTGTLEISTTSDGTDVDADGYSVQVDGGTAQAIPASGTLTIDEVTLGTHSVVLGGLAPNCAVSGENPQSIEVTPGDTSIVAFVVTCRPPTGRLVITSVTGGISPDPDGYTISVGGVPGSPIGANEVVTIDEVPAGTHVVELSGIADNCTVADGPSRTVTVVNGADAAVQFDVTCIAITGTIEVLTATAGSSLDPDGYLISLDGSEAQPIGVNATLRLEALEPGPHVVGLSGQAHNCRLEGENPRPVQLVAGTTTLTFSVTCLGADAMIAFGSNTFDLAAIFVVRPDGSGLTNLTPAGEFERNPVWSPDGSKILFVREDDLYVMHADGSGRVLIAADIGEASGHSWSPDGTLIAFTPSGFRGDEFIQELWVMGADGNHPRRLAANGSTPSWSPDSRRIAYEGDGQIRAINVDGTGGRRLTNQQFGASQPAWSPAGDRIAFLTAIDDPPDRPANRHIFLMNPDGSALQNLSQGR
ncbi:MAG TPA: hypothetical protein VFH26_04400, partial [Gemmatimonadales bacterium]|nr:hypothetical protein [Gemmatimonadales bacterium]